MNAAATTISAWASTAQRGQWHIYHSGQRQIAEYRSVDPEKRTAAEQAVCDEASDAWALKEAGLVRLVQRRVGDGFQYEAVRR